MCYLGQVSYLGLCVLVPLIGRQIQTCRVHAPGSPGHVVSDVGQVALRCRFEISERSSEGHDLSPQSQKSTMLCTKVFIEGLEKKAIKTQHYKRRFLSFHHKIH